MAQQSPGLAARLAAHICAILGYMAYLDDLNPRQRETVLHTSGPLLIVAGAGAGKTKTLTYRIFHLIEQGVRPDNILAVTFTNKAAREMKERVAGLMYQKSAVLAKGSPFIGTFHSLGVYILRENHRAFGLPRHFTIYDRADSARAVKEALKQAGYDPKHYEPGKILSLISRKKGESKALSYFQGDTNSADEISRNRQFSEIVMSVWERYEQILAREKALDFDDLLLKVVEWLKGDEAGRARYRELWRYVHIDEYQDTNRVQYDMARLLVGAEHNLCVVGDHDQMIYSWRGADLRNILDFENDYPEAKVVLLEQNYRSTQTILTAANKVIEKNTQRVPKVLFTKNGEGERTAVFGAYDEHEEARFIVGSASALIKSGVSAAEIAVLYRANFQSRALEQAFLEAGMPYQVVGTRFFERKEIKDVLAYIRAALAIDGEPHPALAGSDPAKEGQTLLLPDNRREWPWSSNFGDLERIINVPPRGIGKTTLLKIFSGNMHKLTPALKAKVAGFVLLMERMNSVLHTNKPSSAVKMLIKESGLEKMFKESPIEEDAERLENIRELASLALKYDQLVDVENKTNGIEELLSDAALASDQDALIESRAAVKLMTVHASKGLEFDHVFITGPEHGLFPHERMGEQTIAEEEEERRLFYVALTRAKLRVWLTYASVRTIFGSRQVNLPSDFFADLDDELLESVGLISF
jgi:DNA helicase-2/ATP-dependent DNA helicase PcrA